MNETMFKLNADESVFPFSICVEEDRPVENCKANCPFYSMDDIERYNLVLDFKKFMIEKVKRGE